jgi:hypothetical protein
VNAHVHVGFVDVFQFTLMLLIAGFFLRTAQAKFSDTALGKALAYIY